jgi:coenzyme F420-dependent glucose-6-phosphate dehydrogenase
MKSIQIGYTLSCEEHGPSELVEYAARAEEAGFSFAGISDHFHPWSEAQGQSPFVFSVIGAISQVTTSLEVLIGVTCPIIRYHPAIVAQAAATCSILLDGRFSLGIGAGENLNEHIVGLGWPPVATRHDMFVESIEIIKALWSGQLTNYFGVYYTVDGAKLYSSPQTNIPLIISAYGPKACEIAGKYGDGFITTSPDKKLVKQFEKIAGEEKPKYAQITICYDTDKSRAIKMAHRYWKFTGLPSPMNTELRLPGDYDKAATLVTPDLVSDQIVCGDNTDDILQEIQKYATAGFDHIYIHQVGPNQENFLKFAEKELLPKANKLFRKEKRNNITAANKSLSYS